MRFSDLRRPMPPTPRRCDGIDFVAIDASLGDENTYRIENGAYKNTFIRYNASGTVYFADSRGAVNKLVPASLSAPALDIPTASPNKIGGIMVGDNLSIAPNGTLSAKDTVYPVATDTTNGLMSMEDKQRLEDNTSAINTLNTQTSANTSNIEVLDAQVETNIADISSALGQIAELDADKLAIANVEAGDNISIDLDEETSKITVSATGLATSAEYQALEARVAALEGNTEEGE